MFQQTEGGKRFKNWYCVNVQGQFTLKIAAFHTSRWRRNDTQIHSLNVNYETA